MSADESRMTVRMPAYLYDWLKENAGSVHNSLNAHVVFILEEYKRQHETADIAARLSELEAEVDRLRGLVQ